MVVFTSINTKFEFTNTFHFFFSLVMSFHSYFPYFVLQFSPISYACVFTNFTPHRAQSRLLSTSNINKLKIEIDTFQNVTTFRPTSRIVNALVSVSKIPLLTASVLNLVFAGTLGPFRGVAKA